MTIEIHISASSLIWGLVQTIVRLPIMAVLGWPLVFFALLGAGILVEKARKKKELGQAISEGIKEAKDEKKVF